MIDNATGKEQKYSMGLDGNIFDDKGNVVQEWDSTFTTQAYGFAGYGQALAGEEDAFNLVAQSVCNGPCHSQFQQPVRFS